MPPTDADRSEASEQPDPEADPTAIAEDGMAPMITNTGADDAESDDADAPSG